MTMLILISAGASVLTCVMVCMLMFTGRNAADLTPMYNALRDGHDELRNILGGQSQTIDARRNNVDAKLTTNARQQNEQLWGVDQRLTSSLSDGIEKGAQGTKLEAVRGTLPWGLKDTESRLDLVRTTVTELLDKVRKENEAKLDAIRATVTESLDQVREGKSLSWKRCHFPGEGNICRVLRADDGERNPRHQDDAGSSEIQGNLFSLAEAVELFFKLKAVASEIKIVDQTDDDSGSEEPLVRFHVATDRDRKPCRPCQSQSHEAHDRVCTEGSAIILYITLPSPDAITQHEDGEMQLQYDPPEGRFMRRVSRPEPSSFHIAA
jgi:hypothetical protein